ncbi:MAG TPA: hypothetical protein VG225_02910 [Terracidiphilus sp.]|nr:hypothetical protein [Terracidiphilus sp.]
MVGLVCLVAGTNAGAKEPPLTAIVLYDGPSGAAYLQLTGVLINGKTEMRECKPCAGTPVDKATYNKQGKFQLAAGGVLERGQDGVLRWTTAGGAPMVVVPLNVKYDKSPSLSASALADQALLKSVTPGEIPPLAPGVMLVFVAAPDTELAEYLLAKRVSNIPGWKAYLAKYPSVEHAGDGRVRLSGLLVAAGEKALDSYKKQAGSGEIDYSELKNAKSLADQAVAISPAVEGQSELETSIRSSLGEIVDRGRTELDDYRGALKEHSPGYVHLGAARKYADAAEGIETTPKGQALEADVVRDSNTYESAIRNAESSASTKQFKQAMVDLAPYRSFSAEDPRIAAIMDAGYAYHIGKGKAAAGSSDWQSAIGDLEQAGGIKDTSEARDLLTNARAQLVAVQDKQAATKALADSAEYEASKDILRAYETLDNLPLAQRQMAADSIERLKPAYIQRCAQFAKEQRSAHRPIRGLSDEEGIEAAYVYLQHAYKLSENDSFHDQMDLLGDDLSAYLLDQAKHYLAKPGGSGTELGWMYLSEAVPYKASNLAAVRDAMTDAGQAHGIRARLSMRVQFRDQTSQRDSPGFAGQLENAVIGRLEASRIPVKVVRAGESTPVEPDYQIEGDVLRHHLTTVPVVEAVESKYIANTREVQSEEWAKVNREIEKAKMDLQTAQQTLEGAEAKGNKKAEKDLTQSVHAAEKKVEEQQILLDSTERTRTENVIRPYSYSKKTVTLTASIQLQFRISNSFANEQTEMVQIPQEDQKSYVLLENVKPEDSEGVKATGTAIDPTEFISASETTATDALIDAVRKRVEALPLKIYNEAKNRENGSDLDGAGEAYLRFLEILPPDDKSVEQVHARQFLKDQFNMQPGMSVAP